jgi:hypothetical protein
VLRTDGSGKRPLSFAVGLAVALGWAGPALAQETGRSAPASAPIRQPPQTPARAQAKSPQECGSGVAVYWAGSGPRIQVVRRGTLTERKPLDPDGPATELVVLEVRISGKLATAYGPSLDQLRRAGSPKQLEEEIGTQVRWQDHGLAGLPTALTVLAEDSPEVIARLRFEQCASRAERARAKPSAAKPVPDPAVPRSNSAPTALPQGAIQ